MSIEIELKLTLSPQFVTDLKSLPLLKTYSVSKPVSQKLHTIYYDTPDLILQSKKIALRLRKVDQDWIQTIKYGGSILAGLHQHHEWEQPVCSNQPDFSKITEPTLFELFSDNILRQQLRPIFITDFTRTIFDLLFMQDCRIELCIDQGEVSAEQRTDPICEVELELKSGTPNQLQEFAALLKEACYFPMEQENINKAMRGYALYTDVNTPTLKK